jgi:hypothetical protein
MKRILLTSVLLIITVLLFAQKKGAVLTATVSGARSSGTGISPSFQPSFQLGGRYYFGKFGLGIDAGQFAWQPNQSLIGYYNQLSPFAGTRNEFTKSVTQQYITLGPVLQLGKGRFQVELSMLGGYSFGKKPAMFLTDNFTNTSGTTTNLIIATTIYDSSKVNRIAVKPGAQFSFFPGNKRLGIHLGASYLYSTGESSTRIVTKDISGVTLGLPPLEVKTLLVRRPFNQQVIAQGSKGVLQVNAGLSFRLTSKRKKQSTDAKKPTESQGNQSDGAPKSTCYCVNTVTVTNPCQPAPNGQSLSVIQFTNGCSFAFNSLSFQFVQNSGSGATLVNPTFTNVLPNQTISINLLHPSGFTGYYHITHMGVTANGPTPTCSWQDSVYIPNCTSSTACTCAPLPPTMMLNNQIVNSTTPAYYSLPCNTSIPFNINLGCSNSTICTQPPTATWQLRLNNTVIQTGTGTGGTLLPVTQNGIYTLQISYTCGTTACTYQLPLGFNCTTQACQCNGWNSLQFNGAAIVAGDTTIWSCNQPFNIAASFNCSAPCTGTSSWNIKDAAGIIVASGTGATTLNGQFTPTTSGYYTVTFNATCGSSACPPVSYVVNVTGCTTSCACGSWGQVGVNDNKYSCGDTIPWSCNTTNQFSNYYLCSANQNCQAMMNWQITDANNNIVSQGTGVNNISGTFTPASNGTYTLTMQAQCGSVVCPPCVYTILVNNCPPPPCNCGPTNFSNLIINAQNVPITSMPTIQLPCNTTIPFSVNFACTPLTCMPSVTEWQLLENGSIIASGTGTSGSFILTHNTPPFYLLRIKGVCGTDTCNLFKRIMVNDCPLPCSNLQMAPVTTGGGSSGSTTCVNPGQYQFTLVPPPPAGTTINYQFVTTPNNNTISSGSFVYNNNGQMLTVPQYVCNQKTGFILRYTWTLSNGQVCKDSVVRNICKPECCAYIQPHPNTALTQTTITGPLSNQSVTFNSAFLITGMPNNIGMIKIQVLSITRNGVALTGANIKSITAPPPTTLANNTGNATIVNGSTAIWRTLVLISPGAFNISGTINNLGPAVINAQYAVKIRYTFYTNLNTCIEMHCEKEITHITGGINLPASKQ